MSQWKDLFTEKAPESLNSRTLAAANIELNKIKIEKRRKLILKWGGFVAASSLASYFGLTLFKNQKSLGPEVNEFEMIQFSQIEEQDVDLLTDTDTEMDLIENLDLIELMEEEV